MTDAQMHRLTNQLSRVGLGNLRFLKAAKVVCKHGYLCLAVVNLTMREELNFISHALSPDSGLKFETPIAHLIPRMPTASIVGDSSLLACGGYLVTLDFWWHLWFPKKSRKCSCTSRIIQMQHSIINCLKYVTKFLNYCTSIVTFASRKINDEPHLVILCVTDNTSAVNWTLHTSKKSVIGRALARFFCGLLISSKLVLMPSGLAPSKTLLLTKYQGSWRSMLLTPNHLPPRQPMTTPAFNRKTRS